jgi:hypothetical protein
MISFSMHRPFGQEVCYINFVDRSFGLGDLDAMVLCSCQRIRNIAFRFLKTAIDGILGFPAVPLQCVAWRFSDFDELPLHMAPL